MTAWIRPLNLFFHIEIFRLSSYTEPEIVVVVQSLSRVQLFATAWTAARQASLSFTISQTLLKLLSIKSVMPFSHLILCCSLLLLPSVFPRIRVFSNESSAGQSIGDSASASVVFLELRLGIQAASCVGPGKSNLPFELRRKAGDCSRVTAGPIDLI